jgi:putative acetyltransferase
MEIVIRRLQPRDATRLYPLFSDPTVIEYVHLSNTSPKKAQEKGEKLARHKDKITFVALNDSDIVGMAILSRRKNSVKRHTGTLTIMVQSTYQGKGIGISLLNTLFETARKEGIELVELKCRTDNPRALALYKKLGFEIEGTLRNRVKRDGKHFDLHVMSKNL